MSITWAVLNVVLAMILLATLLFVGGFWSRKKGVEQPCASKREQCASTCTVGSMHRCSALADPRCKAGNCTAHCNAHCKNDCRLPVGKPGVLRSVK